MITVSVMEELKSLASPTEPILLMATLPIGSIVRKGRK